MASRGDCLTCRRYNAAVGPRHADWLRQADADLRLARHARDGAAHDWACFAAQQAAEKAPSPAPSGSSASLVVKSNNEAAVERAVRAWARLIGDRNPEVSRILWFGSRVTGVPAPGSDVDLCLVLENSDKPFRERIGDYLPVGFPVGLDLFPYTQAELERLRREHPSWHRAMTSGVDLLTLPDGARESTPVRHRRPGVAGGSTSTTR